MESARSPIAITVIGGYLGAGKTTLLNAMLRRADGRRWGIVVNDFGDLAVDAGLLHASASETDDVTPVVNLANGCVCCTLGDDLHTTLRQLSAHEPVLDRILIEASGVADPAAAAAWGTVPGFVPGGVVVAAAADSVMRHARDRYVGAEVRRQLAGAELVIVTKADLCDAPAVERVVAWIGTQTDAPIVCAQRGDVDPDVVLGPPIGTVTPNGERVGAQGHDLDGREYVRWSRPTDIVDERRLDHFLSKLPDGVLRMKGLVDVRDGSGAIVTRLVQVVGRTVTVGDLPGGGADRGLEAIGVAGVLDPTALHARAEEYLHDR